MQDGLKHKGYVYDEGLPFNLKDSRKFNGFSLDEYISQVTESNLKFPGSNYGSYSDIGLSDSGKNNYRKKSNSKSRYSSDFDGEFDLPDETLPPKLAGPNIEVVNPPKLDKQNNKQSQYTNDFKLKEIQLEHDKQLANLDSFAKPKPFFDFSVLNPFAKSKPLDVKPLSSKTTSKPAYSIKLKTKKPDHPLGAASNNGIKYKYENKPKSPGLETFISNSEDEKLESAVREALKHIRSQQRGKTRATAAASKLNPVRSAPGGIGKSPKRPRRPFNPGPQPVRVFNFNN